MARSSFVLVLCGLFKENAVSPHFTMVSPKSVVSHLAKEICLVFSLSLCIGECKRMECNYRRHCGYHPRSEEPLLTCFCPEYRCTGKQNPLCGYDGRTYNSVCLLQLRECVKNTFIGIKHFGACPVTREDNPFIKVCCC